MATINRLANRSQLGFSTTTSWWLLSLVAFLIPGLFPAGVACAQFESDDEVVEASREALREGEFPWYDAEADQATRIDVEPAEGSAKARDSQWKSRNRSGSWDWFWEALGQVLKWFFYILMVALAVFLVYVLIRVFINTELGGDTSVREIEDFEVRSEEDLIESLPFAMKRPQSDLYGEARKHYENGLYDEAIIYLYSYMLVKLDQNHVIRLTRGKTNRQYLRESRSHPELAQILEPSMLAFEDVFFGHHQLAPQRFEACWQRMDDFHHCLEGVVLA